MNNVAQQLLHSLSPPHTKAPPPPPFTALADADAALAAAVQLARLHQKKQQRLEALKAEILALEDSWRTVIMRLEEGRRELEAIISEGDVRLAAIEQAKAGTGRSAGSAFVEMFVVTVSFFAGAIPYPELLAYAQSLSAFTSAPPNLPDVSLPGQPPPPLFFPPFPNEEKMRRGHLNAEEPLGPLGETHSVGRRKCFIPRRTLGVDDACIRRPIAPSPSPEPHRGQAANPYRPMDNRPPQPMFDLDLDLNPDL